MSHRREAKSPVVETQEYISKSGTARLLKGVCMALVHWLYQLTLLPAVCNLLNFSNAFVYNLHVRLMEWNHAVNIVPPYTIFYVFYHLFSH